MATHLSTCTLSDEEVLSGFQPEDGEAIYIPILNEVDTEASQKLLYMEREEWDAKMVRGFAKADWLASIKEVADQSGLTCLYGYWESKYSKVRLFEYPHGDRWFLKLTRKPTKKLVLK